MPTWRELEAEFRELQVALKFSRLDAQWGISGEYWRLAGSYNPNSRRRFEALAYTAGEKLSQTLEPSTESYQEVLCEPDPAWRWYKGIWKISDNFQYASIAQALDDDDTVVGHIFTGSINHPAEASSVFCLELAARYPEENRSMEGVSAGEEQLPHGTVWGRHGGTIVAGIVTTVLGGLILAWVLRIIF